MKVHICHVLKRNCPGALKSAEINSIPHFTCSASPVADHDPSPAPSHRFNRGLVRGPDNLIGITFE